ncbi:unnamed protein product, partial [Aphanomyces euteiches]
MERLGYSLPALLQSARAITSEWDLSNSALVGASQEVTVSAHSISNEYTVEDISSAPPTLSPNLELEMTSHLGDQSHVDLPNLVDNDEAQVAELLEERLQDATANGLPS